MGGFVYLFGFLLIIIINVKLVVDREVFSVLCSIFRNNSWELDIGGTEVCAAFEAASFSMACILACNKISYKNSASLISGRASACDVIGMLTEFQKNDNIVNRKKQQHKSITAFYRK